MFGQYPNAQSVSHICWRGPFHARQKRRQENRQVGAAESGMKSMKSNGCNIEQRNWVGWTNGYGSKPIDTFFRAMNTHLQAILMSTRGIGFWPIPASFSGWWFQHVSTILKNMSSSMGRIIPYIVEHKSHVWNHQPDKWDISNCLPRFWWLESIDSIFLYQKSQRASKMAESHHWVCWLTQSHWGYPVVLHN